MGNLIAIHVLFIPEGIMHDFHFYEIFGNRGNIYITVFQDFKCILFCMFDMQNELLCLNCT